MRFSSMVCRELFVGSFASPLPRFALPISNAMRNSSIFSSDIKRFAYFVVLFFALLGTGLVCACFYLPSRTVGQSMLVVQRAKLDRLSQIQGARVIFVGGSGLGMGMQTSKLAQRLSRPVYNMGLHAGLGIIYQLCAISPTQLHRGDIVVIVPEYANFDGKQCFGDQELVAMLVDVLPEHRKHISLTHWMRLWRCVAKYGAGKIRKCFLRQGNVTSDPADDYDTFGDAKWVGLAPDARLVVPPSKKLSERDYSPTVLRYIRDYVDACREKGVRVVLLPPAYQAFSFDQQSDYIQKVEQELRQNGTPFIASPKRYRLDEKYFYDTPYHLNLRGRELRTTLLIEDLKMVSGL